MLGAQEHLAVGHVLVAEDDARMRTLLATTLRNDGFEVSEASDGGELLDRLAGAPPIDLLITDVNMPELSGLDALRALYLALWHIPIIVITAFGDAAMHAEARRLGAAAVFDKPFDLDDIRTAALHFAGRTRP